MNSPTHFLVYKQVEPGNGELQDRADVFPIGSSPVLVVADGAGGMSGGAEAATFAVQELRKQLTIQPLNAESIADCLTGIDRQMATLGCYGQTTCVVVALCGASIHGASIGDSGAWLVSPAGVDELTAHQRRKPFLGSGAAMAVSFTRKHWNGTLLVASDGLLKYASAEEISRVVLMIPLEQAAPALIKLVRYSSGALPDDVSVIVARST